MTGRLLLDNSAWARLGHRALGGTRAAEVADALEAGRIAVCAPFLLEAGYSAPNEREHADLLAELLALPYLAIDRAVEGRAVDAQAQLARAGHHRLPPVDILVAAIAERHDHGVLHYDGDYDVIRARTTCASTACASPSAARCDAGHRSAGGDAPMSSRRRSALRTAKPSQSLLK